MLECIALHTEKDEGLARRVLVGRGAQGMDGMMAFQGRTNDLMLLCANLTRANVFPLVVTVISCS